MTYSASIIKCGTTDILLSNGTSLPLQNLALVFCPWTDSWQTSDRKVLTLSSKQGDKFEHPNIMLEVHFIGSTEGKAPRKSQIWAFMTGQQIRAFFFLFFIEKFDEQHDKWR